MNPDPGLTSDPPKLCQPCQQLVDLSGLVWAQCGGLHIGHIRQPLVWRLRDKDLDAQVAQTTRHLQGLASFSRLVHEMASHIPDEAAADEFRERAARIGRAATR